MSISIIIPAYNAEKTIERCLKSICKQTHMENITEVLIVDDGSTDSTCEIVEKFVKKDPLFKLVKKENGGVSSARNKGIHQAVGEFIVFCDSDDEMKSELCASLLDIILKQKCDMAVCGYTEVHLNGNISRIPRKQDDEKILNIRFDFDKLFYDFFLNVPWAKIFRKKSITHFFDESMQNGEDIKFVLEYLSDSPMVATISRELYVVHTENENSLSRFRMNALKSITKIQLVLGKFIKENKINADWKRLSDYCLSLVWSNIVDGVNSGQFTYTKACNAIEIDNLYINFLKTLKPNKVVNKITKKILLKGNKQLMEFTFMMLGLIRILKRR